MNVPGFFQRFFLGHPRLPEFSILGCTEPDAKCLGKPGWAGLRLGRAPAWVLSSHRTPSHGGSERTVVLLQSGVQGKLSNNNV